MNPVRRRLLVVEDEDAVQATLKARLEAIGYDVLPAFDGEEALARARDEKPDLIILDLVLPKRDGYSVCRALKTDQRYRQIPVIILTGLDEEEHRVRGLHTGADAYMTKPFDSTELINTVRRLLREA